MRQEMAKDTQAVQTLRDQITASSQRMTQAQGNIGKWPAPKGLTEASQGLDDLANKGGKAADGVKAVGMGGKEAAAGLKAAAIPLVNQLVPGLGAVVGASSMMASAFQGLGPAAVGVGIAITAVSLVIADLVSKMKEQVEGQNKIAQAKVGTSVAKATALYEEQVTAIRLANRELERQAKNVGVLEGTWNALTNAYGRQRAAQAAATGKLMQATQALDEQFRKIEEGRATLDVMQTLATTAEARARGELSVAKTISQSADANNELTKALKEQLRIQQERLDLRLEENAADQGMTAAMKAAEEAKVLAERNAAEDAFNQDRLNRDRAAFDQQQAMRDQEEQQYKERIAQQRTLMDLQAQLGQSGLA